MSTKTPHFCEKRAKKNKVKHGYPPTQQNGIILGHPVGFSSAHNSSVYMNYWSINVNFYKIVWY